MFYCEKLDKISVEEFNSIINQYMQWYRDKRIKLSLGGESDGVDAVLELLNSGSRKRSHPLYSRETYFRLAIQFQLQTRMDYKRFP